MTVREWMNFSWGIFALTLYASIVNFLGLKGNVLYGAIVLGIGICIFFIHRLKHSSDRRIIVDYIEKSKGENKNLFATDEFHLASETSSRKLDIKDSLVIENYGKQQIEELLDFIANWKIDSNFKWDHTTLYDELEIKGVVNEGHLKYLITHKKNTKFFKIDGTLEKHFSSDKKEKPTPFYTINKLRFTLYNVHEEDMNKTGTWSISINTTKEGYCGEIVNKEFNICEGVA